MPSCFVMPWHCFMQLVVCMFLSIVLRSCSLTRLSSHALTLNEVDYLLETPKLRTCLALVVLTRAKRTFFGMTASCGSPPWLWALLCVRGGWSSSACMAVVPAKLFIMWSRVGRKMSKPVHVLWEFHLRCCSLKPLEHMFFNVQPHHASNSLYQGEGNVLQCCHVLNYCLWQYFKETSWVTRPPSWGDLPKDGKVCANWWRPARWSWRCFSLTVCTSVWPLSVEDAIHSSLSLDLTEECRRDWKQESVIC